MPFFMPPGEECALSREIDNCQEGVWSNEVIVWRVSKHDPYSRIYAHIHLLIDQIAKLSVSHIIS